VTRAGAAVVVAVVAAGAAAVDVVVGVAVVGVVVAAGAAVVAVVAVAGLTVGAVVAPGVVAALGAWVGLAGETPELLAAGEAGELAGGVSEGDDVESSATAGPSAGAAAADRTTSGAPAPGSTTSGATGTVSSTTTVVSGWPVAPFFLTTCFLFTTRTDAGPPETTGTALALDGLLKPRMRTPESAATETAPVASTSTPAVAAASAFFLNMGETVTIGGLAVG
jgi:hypothetical protein